MVPAVGDRETILRHLKKKCPVLRVNAQSGHRSPLPQTARNFLSYLGAPHPDVNSVRLLRRQPHLTVWITRLHVQESPLVTASYINLPITLRCSFSRASHKDFFAR